MSLQALYYTEKIAVAARWQQGCSNVPENLLQMDGYTSANQRRFLNVLCSGFECHYLEVGVFKGATLLSAAFRNRGEFTGIDNFEQGTRDEAAYNIASNATGMITGGANVNLVEANFWLMSREKLPRCNVFFFDANDGHNKRSSRALEHMRYALEDPFIMIVDNWSNLVVQESATLALELLGWSTFSSIQLMSDDDCHIDQWWSSWLVAVVQKRCLPTPPYVNLPNGATPLWAIRERRQQGLISVKDYEKG